MLLVSGRVSFGRLIMVDVSSREVLGEEFLVPFIYRNPSNNLLDTGTLKQKQTGFYKNKGGLTPMFFYVIILLHHARFQLP